MNPLRRLLVWRGERHARFDAVLPSSLPGAVFTSKVTARWRKSEEGSPRTAPVIRAQLRDQASEITRQCSVLTMDTARDLVLAKISKTSVRCDHHHDDDGNNTERRGITVHADIRLSVDPDSRGIAKQHSTHLRELQLSQEAEHTSLLFLRDNVFAESALARIWWIRQHPEHAKVINEDFNLLEHLRTESAAARSRSNAQPDQDGLTAIMVEFMRWLSSDEETCRLALMTLYRLLEKLGPPHLDLATRLRQLCPELRPPAGTNDAGIGLTLPAAQPAGSPHSDS